MQELFVALLVCDVVCVNMHYIKMLSNYNAHNLVFLELCSLFLSIYI